ncbi:pectin lyase fold/virulence factor [Auriculariales sp. MPI-PUGE-AT-0066]|nr:pectin lyase fold/virulence factor [Auriculariales sp. MPI-PUGE-AT-0066]
MSPLEGVGDMRHRYIVRAVEDPCDGLLAPHNPVDGRRASAWQANIMHARSIFSIAALVCAAVAWSDQLSANLHELERGGLHHHRKLCTVTPDPNGGDDAPAIVQAFSDCNNGGTVEFTNTTYNIKTVMNTTSLSDVIVDLKGTLLWDASDIPYWLNASLENGYQNQTSAWHFGGDRIRFYGHDTGTLDGNGQIWYDFVKGQSNYPRRPHAITIWNTTNSLFQGIRFVQSQMWTMTIIHSEQVLLQDIYVNSTSHSSQPARNTDGADTIYSDRIWFNRWTVDNGDDSIAMKANSTNILITNSTFYRGLGVAIGSIGQYEGRFETIENVTASNIVTNRMRHAAYVKTWTGQDVGDPPNGGGGGFGYAQNLVFSNFTINNNTGIFAIGQCTTFSGASNAGDCNSSLFNIRDVVVANFTGTVATPNVVLLQCSAASPCSDINVQNIDLAWWSNGTQIAGYLCSNVASKSGFECTGKTCEKPSTCISEDPQSAYNTLFGGLGRLLPSAPPVPPGRVSGLPVRPRCRWIAPFPAILESARRATLAPPYPQVNGAFGF